MGELVRQHRKRLRISATAAAEAAAGLSRVTLHRIERGEPSVTKGAYMAVFGAPGLTARPAPAASDAAVAAAEVVLEGRISPDKPGADDAVCGMWCGSG